MDVIDYFINDIVNSIMMLFCHHNINLTQKISVFWVIFDDFKVF